MREDEQLVADASSLEFGEVDVGPEERHLDAQALGSVGLGLQIDLDVAHTALGVGLGIERDDQVVVLLLDAVVEVVAIELELLQQLVFLVHLRVVNLYHTLALTQDVLDVAVVPDERLLRDRLAHVALIPALAFFRVDAEDADAVVERAPFGTIEHAVSMVEDAAGLKRIGCLSGLDVYKREQA